VAAAAIVVAGLAVVEVAAIAVVVEAAVAVAIAAAVAYHPWKESTRRALLAEPMHVGEQRACSLDLVGMIKVRESTLVSREGRSGGIRV
jgi:energy-converting hydrogenase A subunit M